LVAGPPALTGENAATVYRDKSGRKVDVVGEARRQQEAAAGKAAASAIERYDWGTGAVQKQAAREQAAELAKVAAAPFARYRDDAELESHLKARMRADDPMAHLVSRKPAGGSGDGGADGSIGGRGAAKPVYSGPPGPPNRYNIRPGYRWDGVDRGNGWEGRLLLHRNRAAVVKERQFMNAVADM
jgi:pre-mRNA-splicing factor CWC26